MSMRVVIVGAGGAGVELAERLGTRHEVVVVENVERSVSRIDDVAKRCTMAPDDTTPAPKAVVGDGTSRLVLGKQLDEHGQTALIAMAGSDEVNLEVGTVGRQVGFDPVIAVLHEPCDRKRYEDAGVTALDRSSLVADYVERTLEFKGEVVPCGIGLGRGEIVEILLASTSPVLDRPLKSLAPDRWRIAAVFRGDELIVPTGETVLAERDRVLLVGQPGVLASVAQYLRMGTPQFPRQFGSKVLTLELNGRDAEVAAEARSLAEACEVTQLFRGIPGSKASAMVGESTKGSVEEETFAPAGTHGRELRRELADQRPGVVACRPLPKPLAARLTGRRGELAALCDAVEAPVLFCRGSFPYRRILLPVSSSDVSIHAAELAIDISRRLGGSLTAVNVDLPRYISGEAEELAHKEVVPIRRLCELYEVPLDYEHFEGNPIRAIVKAAGRQDLVVVARRHRRQDTFWSPDVACRIARRAPCTVIVSTLRPGS